MADTYIARQLQLAGAEQICFYADFLPYSFMFQEIRRGRPALTGGLILHGQENMGKAYYAIHT